MQTHPLTRSPLLALAFTALPLWAQAETFDLQSQIDAVTLYPQSAQITRSATIDLPAGRHQLTFFDIRQSVDPQSIETNVAGASLGPVAARLAPVTDADLRRGAEEAVARLEELEAQLRDAEAGVQEARSEASAARDTLDFLGRITGGASSTAEDFAATAVLIREQSTTARKAIRDAEARADALAREITPLQDAVAKARADLALITGDGSDRHVMTLEVDVAEAGEVTVTFSYPTYQAMWQPAYKAYVDTDTETLRILREMQAYQDTGEPWIDVALVFATDNPSRRAEPSFVTPSIRRIFDPAQPKIALESPMRREAELMMASPAMEDSVEGGFSAPSVAIQGLSQTYSLPTPATLYSAQSGGGTFALAPLDLTPKLSVRAVPLFDDAGYLIADLTNDSGEMLIPGRVDLYRDGTRIGATTIPTLVDGAEHELAFGAIDGIKVSRVLLDRNEGDRGVIRKSNEEVTAARLTVENLTGRAWPVEVRDRVSVSEQEDLEIAWQATPAPDAQDVEDMRGVLAWYVDLEAGQTWEADLTETLRWPEGKVLR